MKERKIVSNIADLYNGMCQRSGGQEAQYWANEFKIIRRFAILGFLDRNEMETIVTSMETLDENFGSFATLKTDTRYKTDDVLPKMKAILQRYYDRKGIKKEA